MADRVYAKILTDTVLEYAPKTYRGISNYNKCEEFMLEDGYLPVVQDSTSTVGNFKYKISSTCSPQGPGHIFKDEPRL